MLLPFGSQSQSLEELHSRLANATSNKSTLETYNELTYYYFGDNNDSAAYYNKKSFVFSEEKNISTSNFDAYYWKAQLLRVNKEYDKAHFTTLEAKMLSESNKNYTNTTKIMLLAGRILKDEGKSNEALEKYLEALIYAEEHKDKKGVLDSKEYLGLYFKSQYETTNSLRYFLEAIDLADELKDSNSIFMCSINLGSLYEYTHDPDKALTFYKRALAINERDNDPNGRAICVFKIGTLYFKLNKTDSARMFLNETLQIHEQRNDELGLLLDYSILANSYDIEGDFKTADEYFDKALKLALKHNDQLKTVRVYTYMARSFSHRGDYNKSLAYYKLCLDAAENSHSLGAYSSIYGKMAYAYEQLGSYRMAYEYQTKSKQFADSVFKSSDTKKQTELKLNYEFDKIQDKLINEANEKEIKNQAKLERQNLLRNFLIFGLILILIILGMVYRSFRNKKKANITLETQKKEIENQRMLVEMKNNEIRDSINYAKRIQRAILPSDGTLKQYLKDSFVLYKPKDIVAGDFYWLQNVKDKVLFAAADCTGHGIPGAMVSVVCNNALNRSVRENGLTDPGEILNKTRELVIEEFEKSDEDVKDGMDIALCSLEGNKLQYAGAHNPLWIVRGGEIIETKANKQPIGQFDNPTPYTTHTFELQKEDIIYLFSDGYVDQFGGDKGKKFKARAFRELLLSIQDKPMEEQKTIIDEAFEDWRGSLEQIDDVCIIGVKV